MDAGLERLLDDLAGGHAPDPEPADRGGEDDADSEEAEQDRRAGLDEQRRPRGDDGGQDTGEERGRAARAGPQRAREELLRLSSPHRPAREAPADPAEG